MLNLPDTTNLASRGTLQQCLVISPTNQGRGMHSNKPIYAPPVSLPGCPPSSDSDLPTLRCCLPHPCRYPNSPKLSSELIPYPRILLARTVVTLLQR